jgi:GNAT superfamily N-acetyltransferase
MDDDFLDGLSIADRERSWSDGLAAEPTDRSVLVVEDPDDGRVCGFACVGDVRPTGPNRPIAAGVGELWAINLEPEAWGRGIGRPLLSGAVDAIRARGCTEAVLWVLEANARARRFYEREGWTADGAVKAERFGAREVREVRYRRAL